MTNANEILQLFEFNPKSGASIEEDVFQNLYMRWNQWKEANPDEDGIEDPTYMYWEFYRMQTDLPFIILNAKNVLKGSTKPKDALETTIKFCYYNALDYSIRTGADLAYGCMMEPSRVDYVKQSTDKGLGAPFVVTKHVFNIVNGKVIDVTLGPSSDYYYYEIIPKKVWQGFEHKEHDSNHNARALGKWVEKEHEKWRKKYNFNKRFTAYVKKMERKK